MKQPKKTIIYDDTCPMCIAVISEVDDSSKSGSFDLKGMAKAKLPQGVTMGQVQKEIHVIDESGKIHRNVGAMLQIIEEYPRWRFMARIGRLPVIYQILQLFYKVVAANRKFIFGPAARVYWLKNVVILGVMAGILLSLPLWAGDSSFPSAPLLPFLPELPVWANTVALAMLFLFLGGALISPRPRPWIFSALGVVVFFVLFDQMRLQPWLYQYMWMLAVLGVYSWRVNQKNNRYFILQTLRIIVASIFFFSGLQKVNPDFITVVFPWIVEPLVSLLPSAQASIESLGVLIPFMEMAIGAGLFLPKLRKTAVVFAALMAGSILLLIGPLGHGWNSVVWPWNIVMPLSTVILFWHTEDIRLIDVVKIRGFLLHKIVIVVFIFLPILSFYNKWDSYLSWTLYSGNAAKAVIVFDELSAKAMPENIHKYIEQKPDGQQLSVLQWSVGELNVPPYPENRVFKAVAANICEKAGNSQGVELVVAQKPTQLRQTQETYHCSDL